MTFQRMLILCLMLFAPLLPVQVAASAPINDAAALQGVKEGKGVFLIDFSDAKKTAFYLEIIKGTHAGLIRQGVKPSFVIVYIGPTVRFLTHRAGWRTGTGAGRRTQGDCRAGKRAGPTRSPAGNLRHRYQGIQGAQRNRIARPDAGGRWFYFTDRMADSGVQAYSLVLRIGLDWLEWTLAVGGRNPLN